MLKLSLIATFATAVTFTTSANPVSSTHDLSMLSPDVAAHVVKLQSYGHRFDRAIEAIFHQASMQQYGFGGCGLDDTGTANVPQS